MSSLVRFSRAIDSQFRHLGQEATYVDGASRSHPIQVIPRRTDQLFELGEGRIHGERPQLEFRVSEVASPTRGDEIHINGRVYQIEGEPQLDLHHLVWIAPALPNPDP